MLVGTAARYCHKVFKNCTEYSKVFEKYSQLATSLGLQISLNTGDTDDDDA